MRIIHSYWSKPYFRPESDKGGWSEKIFHYMSCAFSCLKFKEFYNIDLITDKEGAELFIDKIGLPYDSVSIELNVLDKEYPEYLWAIGKLYSYASQNEPFIHVDNDIFIWKPFRDELIASQLCAHNLEASYKHNQIFFEDILDKFHYVPEILREYFIEDGAVVEVNAGILGGNNIPFFKEYANEAFRFIDRNMDVIKSLKRPGMFNVIYEQYLFSAIARSKKVPIQYLIDRPVDE